MCLDLYYYLGIKITIFLRPSSSFKFTIPLGGGGGGGHYKYLVLFHYLFRLIETLFFYGAIYKKKTHYVLLILNQNWALVILCGRGEGGGSFVQHVFFGVCLEILVFFWVKFIFCDEPRYRKCWQVIPSLGIMRLGTDLGSITFKCNRLHY